MKKKGVVVSPTIFWILGIFVVCIIIYALAFPGQLASKSRDLAFSFGLGELPSERPPEYQGESTVPLSIVEYFNNLVNTLDPLLKTPPFGDLCLIKIGEMPDMSGFAIGLSTDMAEIIKLGVGSAPTGHTKEFEFESVNFQPCIIGDYGKAGDYSIYTKNYAALSFKKCYVDKNEDYCITIVPPPENQENLGIRDNKYSEFLYKSGNRYCLIKLEEGLDDNNIKDNVLTCDVKKEYPYVQSMLNKGYYSEEFIESTKGFVDAVKKAVAATDKPICRVEFDKYPGSGTLGTKMYDSSSDSMPRSMTIEAAHNTLSQSIILININNFQPCIVNGINFYNYLWNGENTVEQYIDTGLIITENDKMLIAGSREKDLFSDRPLIYKIYEEGKGHICLIPTFNDNFNSNCNIDGNTERSYVDNDCLRGGNLDAGNRIPPC